MPVLIKVATNQYLTRDFRAGWGWVDRPADGEAFPDEGEARRWLAFAVGGQLAGHALFVDQASELLAYAARNARRRGGGS